MPYLSRRGDKRVEMGHRPRGGRSPVISSLMDVHSTRRATSGGGGGERVHMDGRMDGQTDGRTEWTFICDEKRGLCPLRGRCLKG
jgi:hypothetical protein